MTRNTSRPAALLVLLSCLAAFFVVAPASPTSAQVCTDPYGCPPTTTTTTTVPGATTTTTTPPPPGAQPSCVVSTRVGIIGTNVDVTVTNVPIGLRINLLLNGVQVDTAIAGATGGDAIGSLEAGTPKSARSAKTAAQGAGLVNVTFDFRVPTGPPGSYTLVAVADGFRADCFPFTILRDVDAQNTDRDNGGGNLARTGFTVLGLLILAAVLLVMGRAMVEASRRRRSSAA
jgi:hypothetical protein